MKDEAFRKILAEENGEEGFHLGGIAPHLNRAPRHAQSVRFSPRRSSEGGGGTCCGSAQSGT